MRSALMMMLVLSSASAAEAQTPHPEGEYGGVVPGQTAKKPDPGARPSRAKRPPARGTLSWVGFEAKDGGAQVFLQSVAPFELTQRVEGATLVVQLALNRLGTNTWRQIDTRYFDNPLSGIVARASSRKGRSSVAVRFAFKNPKDAKAAAVRTATEADGLYYAYLWFPEGTEVPGDPANAKPAADARPGSAPATQLSDPE